MFREPRDKEVFNMALIQCSSCGQMVSDKATQCPNCGAAVNAVNTMPLKVDKLGIGMYILCFLIPLVGFIYYFVVKGEYPKKATSALSAAISGFVLGIILAL